MDSHHPDRVSELRMTKQMKSNMQTLVSFVIYDGQIHIHTHKREKSISFEWISQIILSGIKPKKLEVILAVFIRRWIAVEADWIALERLWEREAGEPTKRTD